MEAATRIFGATILLAALVAIVAAPWLAPNRTKAAGRLASTSLIPNTAITAMTMMGPTTRCSASARLPNQSTPMINSPVTAISSAFPSAAFTAN